MNKQAVQHIFTGVMVSLFTVLLGLTVAVVGPEYEGRFYPVVRDVDIYLVSEDKEKGIQEFRVTAYKQRSCEVKRISILTGATPDAPLRRAHFALKDLPDGRAKGLQIYEGTVVGPVGNYVRVDTAHSCHPLWLTVMSPWGEWRRP